MDKVPPGYGKTQELKNPTLRMFSTLLSDMVVLPLSRSRQAYPRRRRYSGDVMSSEDRVCTIHLDLGPLEGGAFAREILGAHSSSLSRGGRTRTVKGGRFILHRL